MAASLEMAPALSSGSSTLEPTTTTTTFALLALAAVLTASIAEHETGHSELSPTTLPLQSHANILDLKSGPGLMSLCHLVKVHFHSPPQEYTMS